MEAEEEPPPGLSLSEHSWCGSDCPMDGVTWLEAITFVNLLAGQEGLRAAYKISGSRVKWDRTASGYRLPTAAEWQYAAGAGQGTIYSGANEPHRAGWYDQNSEGPLKVAGGEPNC